MNQDDERFSAWARQTLRRSEQDIDPVSAAKLAAARRRALAPPRRSPAWLALPGALAAATALWLLLPAQPAVNPPPPAALEDTLELATEDLGPEFYDNLELIQWLDQTAGETQETSSTSNTTFG